MNVFFMNINLRFKKKVLITKKTKYFKENILFYLSTFTKIFIKNYT